MKHTPGPWIYRKADNADNTGGYDYAILDKGNKIIAETFEHVDYTIPPGTDYMKRPAEYNAKLIAAAPDLLESLQRLVDRMTEEGLRHYSSVERAIAAIKKATE